MKIVLLSIWEKPEIITVKDSRQIKLIKSLAREMQKVVEIYTEKEFKKINL